MKGWIRGTTFQTGGLDTSDDTGRDPMVVWGESRWLLGWRVLTWYAICMVEPSNPRRAGGAAQP